MSRFNESKYNFPYWSSSTSRPYSSSPSKNFLNDMFKIGIDNRNQVQRPDSPSTKRMIKHHIHIPTGSPQHLDHPPSTPVLNTKVDHSLSKSTKSRVYRPIIPLRIKSTALSIPISEYKEESSLQNFPKQTHEQRKLTHERKRKKQQAQILADKYAETNSWFQLKRSLTELKRLATTQEIFIDPPISPFNYNENSLTTLKQVVNEENQKIPIVKSESNDSIARQTEKRCSRLSGASSSLDSTSSQELVRPSLTTSRASFSRPRTARRSLETPPRIIFESFMIASKPIHPLLLNGNHNPSFKSTIKPPGSPLSRSRINNTPLSEEKRTQLLVSDLSSDDTRSISTERENFSRKILSPSPTRLRPPSSIQLTSTIKLKTQIPRCRSASNIKPSYLTNKHYPRFILIADQEHRIESWYHQYPFIHSDDLLTSFQSQQKSTISAFFIDDLQSSNPNITAKTFLQGKPFHINNDWRKYDLILISNNIYEEIVIYLKTIINLIKLSGKIIKIYRINHEEDLKKQVKHICKQLQQQNIQ